MAHDMEYEVGYRKPPKASQFQKGRSGNPSGRPQKVLGIAEVIWQIADQKVLIHGKNSPEYTTMLKAILLQVRNKGATGDLKAANDFIQLLAQFPRAGATQTDMEATASSVKAKLLALVEAHDDSFAERAAKRDQPSGQENAITHECARTEDPVRRPVEVGGDFGRLGENRSARHMDMNATSQLPPASPVPDAGGDPPP